MSPNFRFHECRIRQSRISGTLEVPDWHLRRSAPSLGRNLTGYFSTLSLSLSPTLSKHTYKYKMLRWRQYMVRPSSVLRCPSQGDVTKKDIRFCASRSLQCWVHCARTSVNQPSRSGSRRISQLTFAAENDSKGSQVSARTNVRVCAPQASLLDSCGRHNVCVPFFYFDRVCVCPPLFFPQGVLFCLIFQSAG